MSSDVVAERGTEQLHPLPENLNWGLSENCRKTIFLSENIRPKIKIFGTKHLL